MVKSLDNLLPIRTNLCLPLIAEKVRHAWNTTPVKWYPLPLSTGILLLVFIRWRKRQEVDSGEVTLSPEGQTLKIKRPLHIHVLGVLPLRSMSRLWGYLNSLELPMWFRPFGFRLYAYLFDCNLEEIDPRDLTAYKSLGDFFYRKLAPDSRPIDNSILVCCQTAHFRVFLSSVSLGFTSRRNGFTLWNHNRCWTRRASERRNVFARCLARSFNYVCQR